MRLKLTRFVSEDNDIPFPGYKQVWPLRIVADGLEGMDPNIFVYHAGGQPLDPIQEDVFECVASPNQMQEIPVDKPMVLSDEVQVPYYRDRELRYNCHSAAQAEYVWTTVKREAALLLQNLNCAVALSSMVSVVIEDPEAVEVAVDSPLTTSTTTARPTGPTTTTTTTTTSTTTTSTTTLALEPGPVNVQVTFPNGSNLATVTWDTTAITNTAWLGIWLEYDDGYGGIVIAVIPNNNPGALPPGPQSWADPYPRSSGGNYRVALFRTTLNGQQQVTSYVLSRYGLGPVIAHWPTATSTTSTTTAP